MGASLTSHERLLGVLGNRLATYIAEGGETSVASAAQMVDLLLLHDMPATVRAWMASLNPELGDHSPAEFLREGRFQEVSLALRTFLTHG